ncbi:hypothetical protein B9479_007554 [Cryptococcus floricola]|uniref:Zn(2)-C6 fungal-type domain-containing protein n=1 Tax=Cryptococcus floricola TaxID=2591691 RepID=A0A5D3AM53_9TREE|nr:hypothetical protein B9479_007554 [Cryptococcus floricola]
MAFTTSPGPDVPSLAAALEHDNPDHPIQIAPELMGDAGAPPDIPRTDQEHAQAAADATQNFGSYQNSSARDDDFRNWDNGSNGVPGQRTNPWDDGYRDHPSRAHSPSGQNYSYNDQSGASGHDGVNDNGGDGSDKPRKRARQSKPRGAVEKNGLNADGLPEEGVLDFAHPSGDFKLGPVFVHPPKNVAQACVRCHKIKRKCDNARPRCAGCGKADVACVFELNPATASYVSSLKSDNIALSTQMVSAAERISQLEALLVQSGHDIPPPPQHIESVNVNLALAAVAAEKPGREHDDGHGEKRLELEEAIGAGHDDMHHLSQALDDEEEARKRRKLSV